MTDVREVEADDAQAMVDAGAFLLDVREPVEWEAGHPPDAFLMPLAEVPTRLAELPRDRTIVAFCKVGGRSLSAAEFLIEQGYDAVNVAGGAVAWTAYDLPFVDDAGRDGVVA